VASLARSLRAFFSRSYFLSARSSLIFLAFALASRFLESSDVLEDFDQEMEPDEEDPEDEDLEPDDEEEDDEGDDNYSRLFPT
jgi:hypothetical protein